MSIEIPSLGLKLISSLYSVCPASVCIAKHDDSFPPLALPVKFLTLFCWAEVPQEKQAKRWRLSLAFLDKRLSVFNSDLVTLSHISNQKAKSKKLRGFGLFSDYLGLGTMAISIQYIFISTKLYTVLLLIVYKHFNRCYANTAHHGWVWLRLAARSQEWKRSLAHCFLKGL